MHKGKNETRGRCKSQLSHSLALPGVLPHLLATTALAVSCSPALAQSAPVSSAPTSQTVVEEIIVTAQKRDESIQKVPVAVTALTANTLTRQQISESSQLSYLVPSFRVEAMNQEAGGVNFYIRGIGTSIAGAYIESSVATVVDDVAMARPQMAVVKFFDLERVEILRGPQGTLFGKNASAGVVNIVTAQPRIGKFEALAHLSYANANSASAGNEATAQGAINIPVSQNSALRVSAFLSREDGLVKNIFQNENLGLTEFGARVKYRWEATPDWTITLGGDYAHGNGIGQGILTHRHNAPGGFVENQDALAGIVAGPKNVEVAGGGPTAQRFDNFGFQANIAYNFGDGYSVTNIAAYRQFKDQGNIDVDQLPISFFDTARLKRKMWQFSNELRLTSPPGARFEYQVGLYYLYLKSLRNYLIGADLQPLFPPPAAGTTWLGEDLDESLTAKSYAVFAQMRYSLSDRMRLIAGGRYTYDDLSARNIVTPTNGAFTADPVGTLTNTASEKNFSYKLGVEYDVAARTLAYFTWSRGYKGPAFDEHLLTRIDPEIPVSQELGLKSTLAGGRLVVNLALFRTVFHDFQAQAVVPGSVAFFLTRNAGALRIRGAEAEFKATPLKGLSLSGGLTYNDATYRSFTGAPCYPSEPVGTSGRNVCLPNGSSDASGNQLNSAPKWTASFVGNYETDISPSLRGFIQGSYYYQSSVIYSANGDPNTRIKGYSLVGASIGIAGADDRWRLTAFARNIFDKRFATYVQLVPLGGIQGDNALGGNYWQQFGRDSFRTIGISLDLKM